MPEPGVPRWWRRASPVGWGPQHPHGQRRPTRSQAGQGGTRLAPPAAVLPAGHSQGTLVLEHDPGSRLNRTHQGVFSRSPKERSPKERSRGGRTGSQECDMTTRGCHAGRSRQRFPNRPATPQFLALPGSIELPRVHQASASSRSDPRRSQNSGGDLARRQERRDELGSQRPTTGHLLGSASLAARPAAPAAGRPSGRGGSHFA